VPALCTPGYANSIRAAWLENRLSTRKDLTNMKAPRPKYLQAMVDKANAYLRNSPPEAINERRMLHEFVAMLLMEANSYRGFQYQYWQSQGCLEWRNAGEPEGKEKDYFI